LPRVSQFTFEDERPEGQSLQQRLVWAAVLLGGALLVWFLYRQLTSVHGVPVPPPATTQVNMLPPPPPPPPPPPTPEKPPPEPTPSQTPTPAPQPTPQPQAPAPMQIDSSAQAGTDSYGMSAGSGSGMGAPSSAGTCLGAKCGGTGTSGGISDAFYGRYLSSALQERVERESKVNRYVFTADFAIWITAGGAVSKVQLVRGSGDDKRDQLLASILNGVSGLNAPPASFRFPQRITVRGRKSL
jgi:hypothetical protein